MSSIEFLRSTAVFLRAKFFFETRPGTVHVLCEHFRGSTNQHAIPNRRTSTKEKEILLMWCTTIWRIATYRTREEPCASVLLLRGSRFLPE